jgi:HD-GYP domain-containing protein (c-di-GMP phosphodiesterase class II)
MLRRVSPADAELGMFVHSFEGRWADHPFWQTGFVLASQDDLDRLRNSAVEAVFIDPGKSQAFVRARPERPAPTGPGRTRSPGLPKPGPGGPDLKAGLQAIGRSKREVVRLIDDVRLGRPLAVARLVPIAAELSAEVERNAAPLLSMLRMKAPDHYAHLHSVAVAVLMMNFSRSLRTGRGSMPDLGLAGLLHDIGMATVPVEIVNRPAALTPAEMALVRRHPEAGTRLLRAAGSLPDVVIEACLRHHERVDGSGYPFGLSGDALGVVARMTAICDVYDALTSHRPHARAWPPQRALAEMQDRPGQFDRELMDAFITSLGIYLKGSLVSLRGETLAVVVEDNSVEPTLPTVRSFYSVYGRTRIPPADIRIGSSSALKLEKPAEWGFRDWGALSDELVASKPA